MINRERTLTSRQKDRRDAILRAVREQIVQDGYDGVSMREVAKIASVSPSTLYEIYGSKENLILYSIEEKLLSLGVEEEEYEPGIDRFMHRLQSIAEFFAHDEETGRATARVFLSADRDSLANEVFLANAVEARQASVLEMQEVKQLKRNLDLDFLGRSLISVTWGTVIFWDRGFLSSDDFENELVRSSLSLLLPSATRTGAREMLDVLSNLD